MLTALRLVPLVMLICAACACAEVPLHSDEGHISVVFPGTHKPDKQVEEADGSPVTVYSIELPGCVAYMLFGEAKAPAGTKVDDGLQASRDRILKGLKGKLVSEKNLVVNGVHGLGMRFKGSSDGNAIVGQAAIFADGHRYYQLMALAERDAALDAPEVQNFFKSVQFSK